MMPTYSLMPCLLLLILTKIMSKLSKQKLLFESPKIGVFADRVIQLANNRKIQNLKQSCLLKFKSPFGEFHFLAV